MHVFTRRMAAVVLAAGCFAVQAWAADAPKVKFATTAGDIVVVTGSTFVVAELREWWMEHVVAAETR